MPDTIDSATVLSLLSRLNLDQKIAQLTGMFVTDLFGPPTSPDEPFGLATERLAGIRPHGVGHLSMAWFLGNTADSLRAGIARIQDGVREVTPFGIGALVHNEGINGFLHDSGSQFPTSWAQAATWDTGLVSRASAVTAAHMRDAGVHLLFAPVMDLARDPRWGRVHETYGEDPELVAQISVAFVRGVQAPGAGPAVLAGGKHFVGYGASEGGLNQAVSQLGRRVLADEYAEPFRRAIRDAGLEIVMNSYNEIDGVPSAADPWLLTELLRNHLGFRGAVVSDYDSVNMLRTIYHTAQSEQDAAAQAVRAGLDVELPGDTNFSHLRAAVENGTVGEDIIDLAVARVLRIKEIVGLLPDMRGATRTAARPDAAEAAEVRRSIAERGMVLLKNDGVLPLGEGRKRVVVTGPAADELRIHFGAYTSVSNMEMQVGQMALRNGEIPGIDPSTFNFTDIFQARMPGIEGRFEAKTRELHGGARVVIDALRDIDATVAFAPLGSFESGEEIDRDLVGSSVADFDIVVVVVGERTGWVGNNTAGEGQSTADPMLPGNQNDLIDAVASTGKQVVTVLVSGRPLAVRDLAEASSAVLLAPLLGEEAGVAIADALYGRVNPSGKLPSTFPRTVGQIPIYHGHHFGSGYDHPTGTRHGYGDLDVQDPLYPFGHGLSYSSFKIEPLGPGVAVDGDVLVVRCRVINTGDLNGETVVQVYARDEAASIVRPVRQLLEFARVSIPAGGREDITLTAPIERLHYTMADGRRGIEAGDITVMAALSSADVHFSTTVAIDGSAV
ncbi:glycoside hydrolase family 3 N-terminal domain-containing protein [Arthrobacter sp. efr-133-TYG-118]|uniref:glycoside hydrolase family 3 N-terminal domain-containing protein n=1 Tax=Arthrobacter sp. efr-133-TYG-118 TaxID=3040279 RepID=UPI00254F42C0|nr:glycoside hydrolase family 3 N-terminal domain-containing protein [Arthrobacter sp. efr-133-TYG-118]